LRYFYIFFADIVNGLGYIKRVSCACVSQNRGIVIKRQNGSDRTATEQFLVS